MQGATLVTLARFMMTPIRDGRMILTSSSKEA